MKILLINPSFKQMYGALRVVATDYPPLGLAYLAAVLEKAKHDVKIIDMSINQMSKNDLTKFLKNNNFDIIGISFSTPVAKTAYDLIKAIKSNTDDKIILGGPHPTAMPEEGLKKGADIVVRGEAEQTIVDLITNIKSLHKVKGISYVNKNKVIHNPDRGLIQDLDTIPFPARHLLDNNKYDFLDARKKPIGTILTSRGCPFNCIYCCKNIYGKSFRKRSPKNVVDEMQEMIEKYGIKEIHILDDAFTTNKDHAIKICQEIIKRNLQIQLMIANGIRVDTVDAQMLKIMKKAGLYSIAFGVESGSQRVLDSINKNILIKQIKKAFKLSKALNLETWGFFMLGLPEDTIESMQKTIRLSLKLDPDIAKFFITIPLPGSPLYSQLHKQEKIIAKTWSEYNFYKKPIFEHKNLAQQEIIKYQKKAFRKFYFRPKKILKYIKKAKNLKRLKSYSLAGIAIIKENLCLGKD